MIKPFIYSFLSFVLLVQCGSPSDQKDQINEEQSAIPNVKQEKSKPYILFFGNSITAGYQLDISDAFPALIQDRLDSLGYTYQVINAGLSGETTAGGLNRIEWVLRTIPDIFVLELGANDGLRGLDLGETKKNLLGIISKVKEANPNVEVVLAGMQVPPNLGEIYVNEFKKIFPSVAEKTGAVLIPFILEGVAGDPDLNLSDGIHPTEKGHRILTENIWQYLEPLVEKSRDK